MAELLKAFVCGHPIKHSRSPLIHNHWLKNFGINGVYERIDIAPDGLAKFLATFRELGFVGGNFTIPHKEQLFASIGHRDEAAIAIGAANTVWVENNELVASNTDAYGFSANLDDQLPDWRSARYAMVFGAGGAARAILHALIVARIPHVDLINRTPERAQALADSFGHQVHAATWNEAAEKIANADLLINTTSLGMEGQPEFPDIFETARSDAIASDIVYTPLETPFLKMARARGQKVSDGLGMLLHQATPGFEKWFGVKPTVDQELRQLVLADIERSASQ